MERRSRSARRRLPSFVRPRQREHIRDKPGQISMGCQGRKPSGTRCRHHQVRHGCYLIKLGHASEHQLRAQNPPHALADNDLCVSSRFRLLNLRTDMRIAFIRNGFEFPIVAAWGEVIRVANVNEPLQGHLALTGENRYQRLVAWHASCMNP